jgi:hypothetical protein
VSWHAREPGLLFAEPTRIRRRQRSLSDHFGFQAELDWQAARMRSGAADAEAPDPRAFDLARGLLDLGREEADRRERQHFLRAGGFLGAALLAATARRHPKLDRRRFLRGASGSLAALFLAPAVAYGTLARLDSDYKRNAFDDAHGVLAQLRSVSSRRRTV